MVKTETSGLTATIFKVVAGGRVGALKKKREQILVKMAGMKAVPQALADLHGQSCTPSTLEKAACVSGLADPALTCPAGGEGHACFRTTIRTVQDPVPGPGARA